jgi:hypothetical protein
VDTIASSDGVRKVYCPDGYIWSSVGCTQRFGTNQTSGAQINLRLINQMQPIADQGLRKAASRIKRSWATLFISSRKKLKLPRSTRLPSTIFVASHHEQLK